MKPVVYPMTPPLTLKQQRAYKVLLLWSLKQLARREYGRDEIKFYPMLITEGICNNIKFLLMDRKTRRIDYEQVIYQFAECCDRMGLDRDYPVNSFGTIYENNKSAYHYIENKWIGYYGETRKALIIAIMRTLERELWGHVDKRNFLTRAQRLWEMGEPVWLTWVVLWVIGSIGAYALFKCAQILFYQLSELADIFVRFVNG